MGEAIAFGGIQHIRPKVRASYPRKASATFTRLEILLRTRIILREREKLKAEGHNDWDIAGTIAVMHKWHQDAVHNAILAAVARKKALPNPISEQAVYSGSPI